MIQSDIKVVLKNDFNERVIAAVAGNVTKEAKEKVDRLFATANPILTKPSDTLAPAAGGMGELPH